MAPSGQASTPSRPMRSTRRQVESYNEDNSAESSSDEAEEPTPSSRSRLRPQHGNLDVPATERPRRATHAPRTYREPSSDEDLDQVISRYPDVVTHNNTPQSSASIPHRPPRQTRSTTNLSPNKKTKRPLADSRRKRRRTDENFQAGTIPVPAGPIPPWTTLPYHILFNIFLRASHPLVDKRQGTAFSTTKWLLEISLLCRSFAEPALAALYHTPVLIPRVRAHKILKLLSQSQDSLSINYASKVQELLLDVRTVLAYKARPAYGYFDISKLIESVPNVKTLRLYHQHDGVSPMMPTNHAMNWRYPDSLFETLNRCNVRLHGFDWNARFMEPHALVDTMQVHHLQAPFLTIRNLRLFQITSEDVYAETEAELQELTGKLIETRLGAALRQLPELRRLSFTDCTAVNELLLPKLPTTLESLYIDNCDEVASNNLAMFLASHGAHLRELVLKHNRHLNMSFIVRLADSCPNLERLSLDFLMHNWPPYYNGLPHFDHLFRPGEVPSWPKALQDMELMQLRQWDKTSAAAFFGSLVDAAPDLKDLRSIVISATVPMGWQDRASFRRHWMKMLERTFLRKDESSTSVAPSEPTQEASAAAPAKRPSSRHSARVARQRLSEVDDGSDDNEALSQPPTTSEGGVTEVEEKENTYVQGMCDVVSLRIDNLRPAEAQFNEGDFLNSEESGDEDWVGEDWEPNDEEHAW